jgi:hypothetical protein
MAQILALPLLVVREAAMAVSRQGWRQDIEGQSITGRKDVTLDLTANF